MSEKYGWKKCERCGVTRPPAALNEMAITRPVATPTGGGFSVTTGYACKDTEWCATQSGGRGALTGANT